MIRLLQCDPFQRGCVQQILFGRINRYLCQVRLEIKHDIAKLRDDIAECCSIKHTGSSDATLRRVLRATPARAVNRARPASVEASVEYRQDPPLIDEVLLCQLSHDAQCITASIERAVPQCKADSSEFSMLPSASSLIGASLSRLHGKAPDCVCG